MLVDGALGDVNSLLALFIDEPFRGCRMGRTTAESVRRVALQPSADFAFEECGGALDKMGNLYFSEVKGDLFCASSSKVFCASADLFPDRGLTARFMEQYGRVDELKAQNKREGEVAYLEISPGNYIFVLLRKERHYDRPSYETLGLCLGDLSLLCRRLGG